MSIIDAESFWIYAYFEETQLERIHNGDPVRIALMGSQQPVSGHVDSVSRGITDRNGQLGNQGLQDVDPIFTYPHSGGSTLGTSITGDGYLGGGLRFDTTKGFVLRFDARVAILPAEPGASFGATAELDIGFGIELQIGAGRRTTAPVSCGETRT